MSSLIVINTSLHTIAKLGKVCIYVIAALYNLVILINLAAQLSLPNAQNE